jgi:tetratricopeptide (TPR) repeat protein
MIAVLLCLGGVRGWTQASEDEVTPAVQQLYQQARAAQQRGDSATAIDKYRSMIQLAPHLAPAYNNLGMLYFNQHDFSHAAETLEQGLKLNPDMPGASAMLGTSYFELGPLIGEAFETALRANPTEIGREDALEGAHSPAQVQ